MQIAQAGSMLQKFLLLGLATVCFGQRFDVGVKSGLRITDELVGGNPFILSATSESKRYIVGPMLDIRLPLRFSFEFDALYRRFGFTSQFTSEFPGFSSRSRERANSWEFPMILKYRLAGSRTQPFAGVGYAPRSVDGTDVFVGSNQPFGTKYPVTHGLVVAGGLNITAGHLRISPELRYVHWNAPFLYDNSDPDITPLASRQDELFFLLGLSWHRARN